MAKKINARVSPPTHHSKNPYLSRIVSKSPPKSQSQRYKRLTQAINKRELTSSLEILAQNGIEGDTAIFVLACCQEVAA